MTTYLTQAKLEELKQELEKRTKEERRAIAERIAAAKELGDLSENFEYHDAKDAQGMNEARIREIEAMIQSAVIVDESSGGDQVTIGSTFTVKTGDLEKTFMLVGAAEANPLEGRISNESPLGQAFLGKKPGDSVSVEVPSGSITYDILSIQ